MVRAWKVTDQNGGSELLSVWEPGEHIISGPKVGNKNEEEKGFSHILSLLTYLQFVLLNQV